MLQHEGSVPLPAALAVSPVREPRLTHRLIARVRWFSLDGRLAAGEDPAGSPLLAAQAARLTASRYRERLAAALGGLLLAAEREPRAARVSPSRSALLSNEAAVRELARHVEQPGPLYARGLARLERLLSDSTGPAFRGGPGELAAELDRVAAELSGRRGPEGEARSETSRARSRSVRRLARLRGSQPGRPLDPPGFAGGSFVLPDGSWFHGRREG